MALHLNSGNIDTHANMSTTCRHCDCPTIPLSIFTYNRKGNASYPYRKCLHCGIFAEFTDCHNSKYHCGMPRGRSVLWHAETVVCACVGAVRISKGPVT